MTRNVVRWTSASAIVVTLAVVASFIAPRSRAQAQQHFQPLRSINSLRVVDTDVNRIADMGPTYDFLERRARRVTTKYDDGMAIAERGLDGSVRTRLHDIGGNELSQLAVDHDGLGAARLEFSAAGERVLTQPRAELRPTLDWANLQAYSLWKDRPAAPEDIEWKGRFVRARRARLGTPEEVPNETETEFDNGLRVISVKNKSANQAGPQAPKRATYTSKVLLHGAEVGTIRWFATDKVLSWDFPGLTKGFVDADRLKRNNGWTFTPTLAWANVQGLAFYEFHSKLKTQGSVAGNRPGLPGRLASAVSPAVAANEPGCDGLHWLDKTVFRPCCDQHDRCYEKVGGCSASSWYWVPWWGNAWACSVCNTAVTFCFITGGRLPFHNNPTFPWE